MLQAQITGYTETGIPEIYLYAYLDPNVSFPTTLHDRIAYEIVLIASLFRHRLQNIVFINEELVARNYAVSVTAA